MKVVKRWMINQTPFICFNDTVVILWICVAKWTCFSLPNVITKRKHADAFLSLLSSCEYTHASIPYRCVERRRCEPLRWVRGPLEGLHSECVSAEWGAEAPRTEVVHPRAPHPPHPHTHGVVLHTQWGDGAVTRVHGDMQREDVSRLLLLEMSGRKRRWIEWYLEIKV